MIFSKIFGCVVVVVFCISWINICEIECAPSLILGESKDRDSWSQPEHVKSVNILKKSVVEGKKDLGMKFSDGKKQKRDTNTMRARIFPIGLFRDEDEQSSFAAFKGLDVPFYQDEGARVSREQDSSIKKADSNSNKMKINTPKPSSIKSLNFQHKMVINPPKPSSTKMPFFGKKDFNLNDIKKPEKSRTIGRDEGILTLSQEAAVKDKLDDIKNLLNQRLSLLQSGVEFKIPNMESIDSVYPSSTVNVEKDPGVFHSPTDIPRAKELPDAVFYLDDLVKTSTLISKDEKHNELSTSTPTSKTAEPYKNNTTISVNSGEVFDETKDLMSTNNRLGRKVATKQSKSTIILPKANNNTEPEPTDPVKYEGTLVTVEHVNDTVQCTPNDVISDIVFGNEPKESKLQWVESNKGSICDYNKFQNCVLLEEAPTTDETLYGQVPPDPDPNVDPDPEDEKNFCRCLTDLILVGDTCYIPAGVHQGARCNVQFTYPAGSVPPTATLKPQCTPNSKCVLRPDHHDASCQCKPNTKYNKVTFTCSNAPHNKINLFYLLIMGASSMIKLFVM